MKLVERPMTAEDFELLIYLEQYWYEYGTLPTREKAAELELDLTTWDRCWSNSLFRLSLTERGVSLKGTEVVKGKWRTQALSEKQLAVANTLLDGTDTRSQKKKLSDLGVTTATYQSWLRDPAFQNYIRNRSENALHDNQHEAHIALIDRVKTGDTQAIKYFNELTGRHIPASQGGASGQDVAILILRVLEVIQKFVTDTKTQAAIAEELTAIAELPSGGPVGMGSVGSSSPVGVVIPGEVISEVEGVTDL